MSLKRAKLLAKWQTDQGFQRKSLSPCGLRCLYFYNGVFREALNNMSPKNIGLIKDGEPGLIFLGFLVRSRRFALWAALLLWVMMGFCIKC